MLTFDSALQSLLDSASSKLDWANIIKTQLGNTRRLRCKRTSNTGSTDVWTDGTEFLNVGMTGELSLLAGNITGFGKTTGTTVRLAADLSTGLSVLRIEGNGHFVQGTFGLTGSGADFTVQSSPTTTSGIGFSSKAKASAPVLLPSGTGPIPPDLDANSPATVTLEDWSNPASPVTVGSITFNNRKLNWVFDDLEVASEMGDVRITQCTQSLIFGDTGEQFEFGATLFSINGSVNSENSNTIHQVLIACKPYGRWASYPAADTFNMATDITFPKPFKMILKKGDGSVLHTWEMRDGLPINSPQLVAGRSDTNALRPLWNCAEMLEWESYDPKISTKATKWLPGFTADSIRPSQAKFGTSSNGAIPLISGRGQVNSYNQWFALPQWATPSDQVYGSTTENNALDPNSDPYLFNVPTYFSGGGGTAKGARATGWDYEPGSISGHDWYTGPGGPRFDRAVVPTPLALFMSDPTGSRLHNNETYKMMCKSWGRAYFNHSHHYITDVKTLASIPDQEAIDGLWSFADAYYGTSNRTAAKSISLQAIGNGNDIIPVDKNGNPFWNGWALDDLHSYAQPGWWALIFNSPMHAYSAKLRFNSQWMSALQASHKDTPTTGFFMVRAQAWRWLHLVMMWKLSSNHDFGISRAQIEDRFQTEIETMHDTVYLPAYGPSPVSNQYFDGIRNLGIPVSDNADVGGDFNDGNPPVTHTAVALSNGLTYYMSNVLALMKQTGCWNIMRSKSAKCQTALTFLIQCLDKYSLDFILDTDGRKEGYVFIKNRPIGTPISVPSSWAAWATDNPKVGVEDWIHSSDGSFAEYDVAQHLRAQYAFMRRDFFPEITNPRLAAACTKYQNFYDTWAARVAAETVPFNKTLKDWPTRYPSLGILKPPTELGAA